MTHSYNPLLDESSEEYELGIAERRAATVAELEALTVELRWSAQLMFHTYGTPTPQGSKKGFVLKGTNRTRIVDANAAKLAPWREAVKNDAVKAMGSPLMLDEPLQVELHFTLSRPAAAPKRLRTFPRRKPDIDKLVRSILDSLSDAGAYHDDSQVISLMATKHYPGEGEGALSAPGVFVLVRTLDGPSREGVKLR